MSTSVLKLDAAWRPQGMIPWYEAIRLLYLGKATVVEQLDDEFWVSPSVKIPKPLVIHTHHYVKLKGGVNRSRPTKHLLYLRDNGTCQYCMRHLALKDSTRDHVLPKSRGDELGKSKDYIESFENQVLACRPCNHKKADKLPWECGMNPRVTPKAPQYVPTVIRGATHQIHRQYIEYFYELPDDPNLDAKEFPA